MKETIFDIIRRHDEWFYSEETTPPDKIAQIYEDMKQSAIQYAHDLLDMGDRWHTAFKNQIGDAFSKPLYHFHIDKTKYKYILEDFLLSVKDALIYNCGLDENELRQKFNLKIQFLIGLSDTPDNAPQSTGGCNDIKPPANSTESQQKDIEEAKEHFRKTYGHYIQDLEGFFKELEKWTPGDFYNYIHDHIYGHFAMKTFFNDCMNVVPWRKGEYGLNYENVKKWHKANV